MIRYYRKLQGLRDYFPTFGKFPLVTVAVFLVLGIGTIVTVNQLQEQQETTSHAQFTCSPVPPEQLGTKPDLVQVEQSQQALAQTQQTLLSTYNQYIQASQFEKSQYVASLESLLAERKQHLIPIMRHNPTEALKYILSPDQRSVLASISPGCVETEVTEEGTLEVLHADFFEDKVSQTLYTLKTINGKILQLHQGGQNSKNLVSSMKVKVSGYQLDSDVVIDSERQPLAILEAPPVDTIGEQKTIVLMVYFQDTPQPNLTKAQVEDVVFTQTNNYYKEVSYNKAWLTGTVMDWKKININKTCETNLVTPAAIQAADAEVNFTQYGRLIIAFPYGYDCGAGALATLGKLPVQTADGQVMMSISWDGITRFNMGVVGHEYGHNFGVHHSNFLNCGNVSLSLNTSVCTDVEYGDIYTIMGYNTKGHLNAVHKDYLQWFNSTDVIVPTTNGTYTISPMASTSSSTKTIKIQRGSTTDPSGFLYIEFRQPLGFDSNIKSGVPEDNVFDGALIHIPSREVSWLIDTSPPGSNISSALLIGQTFTDPATGTVVRVVSKTETALTVEISLGIIDFPTASIISPRDGDTVSGTITFTANASAASGIQKVELYSLSGSDPNIPLGISYTPPYTFYWDSRSTTYALSWAFYVKAYANSGGTGRSEVIWLTIDNRNISPTPTPCDVPPVCAPPPEECSYEGATSCSCGTLVCSSSIPTTATAPPRFLR